jgi:hypothetical protein
MILSSTIKTYARVDDSAPSFCWFKNLLVASLCVAAPHNFFPLTIHSKRLPIVTHAISKWQASIIFSWLGRDEEINTD